MTREEAINIIEEFAKAGGNIFIDGCKGSMPDNDLFILAEDCRYLLQEHNGKTMRRGAFAASE